MNKQKLPNSGTRRQRARNRGIVAACATAIALAGMPALAKNGHGGALREDNREVRMQLAMLRKATAAFSSHDIAAAAGWSATISECVESPMGAMGYHVANMSLLDGEETFHLSLLRPEVLLYMPLADGSMEFLGVEYIVPYTPDNASTPPEILGQKLQYNPHQEIWALHVWTGRNNPDGIFAPFNPDLACPGE